MKSKIMMLAIMSAIITTGLVVSPYAVPQAYATNNRDECGQVGSVSAGTSVSGSVAAGSSGSSAFCDTSAAAAAGGEAECEAGAGFTECEAEPRERSRSR